MWRAVTRYSVPPSSIANTVPGLRAHLQPEDPYRSQFAVITVSYLDPFRWLGQVHLRGLEVGSNNVSLSHAIDRHSHGTDARLPVGSGTSFQVDQRGLY